MDYYNFSIFNDAADWTCYVFDYAEWKNQRLYISCINNFAFFSGCNYFYIYEENEYFQSEGTWEGAFTNPACTAAEWNETAWAPVSGNMCA